MVAHSQANNKIGIGAKFPVHYSYTDKLLEWFPNCRLLHTTRNPKGVCVSQVKKHTSSAQSRLRRSFSRTQQFVHINIQTTWTAALHQRYKDRPNYMLVKYEDVVNRPEDSVARICDFLEVEVVPSMFRPKQYGSSFSEIGGASGINSSSIERWREEILPAEEFFLDRLQGRAARTLGY